MYVQTEKFCKDNRTFKLVLAILVTLHFFEEISEMTAVLLERDRTIHPRTIYPNWPLEG